MASVLLVIHMFLALAIIGLVLLQRSEGGGLGIGGSGGLGGLATPQGTANILSRATGICAAGFFATSLALGAIAGHSTSSGSILDKLDTPAAAVDSAATTDKSKVTPNSPEAPAAEPKADVEEKAVNDNKDAAKDTSAKTTEKPTKDTGPKTPSAPISE